MPPKIYVVHGSHPCLAVLRAAELKGVALKQVELPPPAHALLTRALGFKQRTVPALKLPSGEKLSGSSRIMAWLDEQVAEPAMYPADAAAAAKVREAERLDDDVMQVHARRIIWTAFKANGKAMPSFLKGSKLPLPAPVVVLNAPVIARIELRLNPGSEGARAEIAALEGNLDRIDAWIAEGVLGGPQPNAADLKLGASLWLLDALADLRPVLAGRPCLALIDAFPPNPGSIPAGALAMA